MFLFGWIIIFCPIYTLFCKKYEEKLIQQKEEEISRLEQFKKKNGSVLSIIGQSQIELRERQEVPKRQTKTKSTLEFEDAMQYWGSQIGGMTRL